MTVVDNIATDHECQKAISIPESAYFYGCQLCGPQHLEIASNATLLRKPRDIYTGTQRFEELENKLPSIEVRPTALA